VGTGEPCTDEIKKSFLLLFYKKEALAFTLLPTQQK
jgi:hypothetical protein